MTKMIETERDKLLGRPFLDEVILALIVGNRGKSGEQLRNLEGTVHRVRRLLLGEGGKHGRPETDHEMDLLYMAYEYYWQAGREPAELLDEGPDPEIILMATKRLTKSMQRTDKETRIKTLVRKFEKEFSRLMYLIDTDFFDDNAREYQDLILLKEIFERNGYGFAVYGKAERVKQ